MLIWKSLKQWVYSKISRDSLAIILMILSLICGISIGYQYTGKSIERDCNNYIIENYIIPDLELQGYNLIKDGNQYLIAPAFSYNYSTFDFNLSIPFN